MTDRSPKPGAVSIPELVDELLAGAAEAGVSDVHFEPGAREMQVRYRLDGRLKSVEALPRSMAENVIARIKVLAGLLTYRNDIPQEGRIDRREAYGRDVTDLRVATFPTVHGQRAVVRIFSERPELRALDGLGLPAAVRDVLVEIAAGNQGLVLVTGPAGSGKSTTLAALLRHIRDRYEGKSIVALEDPVERHVEGVTQVEIRPGGEMTFPTALRSLLRQDPEVLMIGEVRDAETARIAAQAGLTGHLVLTTMHAGTPAAALLRLLEMGIEPYEVTSSVRAVVNQRLLRRLCTDCDGAGCDRCFETGFRGRVAIAEVVRLDGALRKALLDGADLEGLGELLARRGHQTLLHAGRRLVAEGITSPEELAAVVPEGDPHR